MHAALDGGDAVGEGVDALVEAGVPLECDLDLHGLFDLLERADLAEEGLLGGIQVPDVVDDAVFVLERLGRLGPRTFVGEIDLQALVEEGHDLETLDDGLGPEVDLLEDGGVGPEGDRGPGPVLGRRAGVRELPGRLATVEELHGVVPAVAVDLEDKPGGQGVDHRDADAMESAGHLVGRAAEFPAGVQRGEHQLRRRLVRILRAGSGWNPAAVVDHLHAAVGQQGHVDPGGIAGHGLVDRVVDNLPDQVVQPGGPGRADVHARSLPDRVQSFQNSDVARVVTGLSYRSLVLCFQRHRRALSNIVLITGNHEDRALVRGA